MRKIDMSLGMAVFFIALFLATVYGWVANIFMIAGGSFDPLTGVMVLRCVGIFVVPLGAVMGYIG